jgi:hypothetical protein
MVRIRLIEEISTLKGLFKSLEALNLAYLVPETLFKTILGLDKVVLTLNFKEISSNDVVKILKLSLREVNLSVNNDDNILFKEIILGNSDLTKEIKANLVRTNYANKLRLRFLRSYFNCIVLILAIEQGLD